MLSRVRLALCFMVLVVSQSLLATKDHLLQSNADEYISKTLNSLEKLADFYVRNIDKVNLDSVYGIRVAEGSLSMIVENMRQNGIESDGRKHFSRIKTLLKSLNKTANKAQPLLKKYQSDYYTHFKPIVDKAWTYFKDFDDTGLQSGTQYSNTIEKLSRNATFNERTSDRCMTEIMGTAAGQKDPCYVSNKCLMLMTSPKLRNYGNTHQILYFLLGFQHGCRNILEEKIKKSRHFTPEENISNVDSFLEKKCEQIFGEMKALEATVYSMPVMADLFMEQGLVCGILGYKEFLSHKILQNIFSWQDSEHGCFGMENQKQFDYEEKGFVSRNTMRRLLYDRTLSNGCSSHETGVATGLLSVYLRWLLTYIPEDKI